VIAPRDPNLPYIQPPDRNCATSSPNALLGSRYGPQDRRPTIMVNAEATSLRQLHPFFDLHSLSIKPIALPVDAVPVIANVTITGWAANQPEMYSPVVFRVEWTSGYTEPLLVDLDSKQFSEYKWEALEVLDLSVDYGPDQLDWEFCLDDLTVGFTRCKHNECEGGRKRRETRWAQNAEREEL
jgi:hypothetical protein